MSGSSKGHRARNIPVLTCPRLRLRTLREDDAPAILDIHSDPETVIYWSDEPLKNLRQAEDLVQENLAWVQDGACLYWAIDERATERTIGTCSIFDIHPRNRRAELGYILHRAHWGKGLMSEALNAAIGHAFNGLDLHRLEADTDPNNAASIAVLEKFGFRREGNFRERWFVHGRWHDSVMLGLLKAQFKPARTTT